MDEFYKLVQDLEPNVARIFKRGSVDVLDQYNRTLILPSNGHWMRSSKHFGVQHVSTPTIIADAIEQRGTSGTLFVECSPIQDGAQTNFIQRIVSKRSGAGEMWRLLAQRIGSTRYLIFSDGTSFPLFVYDWRGCSGIAVTFEPGSNASFFCDGVSVGSAPSATTVTEAPVQINVGSSYLNTEPMITAVHCIIQFSTVLTSQSIEDLHSAWERASASDFRETRKSIFFVSENPVNGLIPVETFGAEFNNVGALVGKNGVSIGTQTNPTLHYSGNGFIEGAVSGYTTLNSLIDFSNPDALMNVEEGALEIVVEERELGAANYLFSSNVLGTFQIRLISSNRYRLSIGSPQVDATSDVDVRRARVPQHIVVTWGPDGLGGYIATVYLDRIQIMSIGYTGSSVATYAQLMNILGAASADVNVSMVRFYDKQVTIDQVGQLYAKVALAGSVFENSRHMPPISFTLKTGGQLGQWDIGSGSWYIKDDGTKRILINSSSGWATRHCGPMCHAFGAWYWTIKKGRDTTATLVLPIATVRGPFVASGQNGYTLAIGVDESIALYRTTNGAVGGTVFITASGYVSVGIEYELCMTRRFDGLFTLYIRGGSYSQWTVVASGTDTTYLISSFVISDLDTDDEISTVSFFPAGGTLTPGEIPGLED